MMCGIIIHHFKKVCLIQNLMTLRQRSQVCSWRVFVCLFFVLFIKKSKSLLAYNLVGNGWIWIKLGMIISIKGHCDGWCFYLNSCRPITFLLMVGFGWILAFCPISRRCVILGQRSNLAWLFPISNRCVTYKYHDLVHHMSRSVLTYCVSCIGWANGGIHFFQRYLVLLQVLGEW